MKKGITFVVYLGSTNWGTLFNSGTWRLDLRIVTLQVCFYDLDYRYKLILQALRDSLLRFNINPDRYISGLFKREILKRKK